MMLSRTQLAAEAHWKATFSVSMVFRRLASTSSEIPSDVSTGKKKSSFLGRLWTGKSKAEEEGEHKDDKAEDAFARESRLLQDIEEEERTAALNRSRNKSRLSASDRRILHGQPPLEGLAHQITEEHSSRKFKAKMAGHFGFKATGLSPSVGWPTDQEIDLQKEYERVYLDNISIKDAMEAEWKRQRDEKEAIRLREEEVARNFTKMDTMVLQWKNRIESRNRLAQKEKEKKESILAELRQEFGYDVNPADPQFAERFAAKEKEMNKAAKEEKKKLRAERAKLYEKKEGAAEEDDEDDKDEAQDNAKSKA